MFRGLFGGPREDEIAPAEVEKGLGAPDAPFLLDVREPHEYTAGHIPGAVLISLGALPQRQAELPRDRPIVAICRSGARSGVATGALRQAGLEVKNMVGGMLAWKGPVERG